MDGATAVHAPPKPSTMIRIKIGDICHDARQRLSAVALRKLPDRWVWAVLGSLIALAGLAVALAPARAGGIVEDAVVGVVGFLCTTIIGFLGQLLLIVVGVLINIAQYNGFVTSAPVGIGWVIVRDVVNMFFIVVLLILAFGTILGVQAYSIKGGNLTRLLIMAIVVNFSRTLCGLMIDFAQVVMLTFVSGFRDAAGGNFVEAMKINEMLQAAQGGQSDVSVTAIVISLLLAVVMVAIALYVVIMMTIALLIRIVFLWMLVILSPAAFFLKAVPGGQASKAYADWWSKFTANVLVGPLLAFFLWLSLVTVQQGNLTDGFKTEGTGETMSDAVSGAFNAPALQTFMIACCMLVGGYIMAQEVGGSTMGLANKLKSGALGAAKFAGKQFTKRTGIESYLSMRRQQKEEKYAARGAKIAGGVGAIQLAAGKVMAVPGKIAGAPGRLVGAGLREFGRGGKGGRFRRAMGRAGEEIGRRGLIGAAGAGAVGGVTAGVGAVTGGIAGGATRLYGKGAKAAARVIAGKEPKKGGWRERAAKQVKEYGEEVDATGKKIMKKGAGVGYAVGAAVGGLPGKAIDAPAEMAMRAGRQSQKLARDKTFNETNKEKAAAGNLTRDEVTRRATKDVGGISPAEKRGAMMRAVEQKFVTGDQIAALRDGFKAAGSDKASDMALEELIKKNYPAQAVFEEAEIKEGGLQARINRGDLELKGMRPDAVKELAPQMAQAPWRAISEYEKSLMTNPQQKDAYMDGLKGATANGRPADLPRPEELPKDATEEQKKEHEAKMSKWNEDMKPVKAAQQSYDNAIGSLSRIDPKEGMAHGYGATSKGEISNSEKQKQLEEAAGKQGFSKTAILLDPQSIADAEGKLSDLGKSILQGISSPEFENMAKDSSGKPQQQLMQRLIDGIHQLDTTMKRVDENGKQVTVTEKDATGKEVPVQDPQKVKQKEDLTAMVQKSRVFADKFPADVETFKKKLPAGGGGAGGGGGGASGGGEAPRIIPAGGGGGGGARRDTGASSAEVAKKRTELDQKKREYDAKKGDEKSRAELDKQIEDLGKEIDRLSRG